MVVVRAALTEPALASGNAASRHKRVLRSTSVATALLLSLPLMRSASQCPGILRPATSAGRSCMLRISFSTVSGCFSACLALAVSLSQAG